MEDKDEGASGSTLTFPVLSVHDQSIKATKKKRGDSNKYNVHRECSWLKFELNRRVGVSCPIDHRLVGPLLSFTSTTPFYVHYSILWPLSTTLHGSFSQTSTNSCFLNVTNLMMHRLWVYSLIKIFLCKIFMGTIILLCEKIFLFEISYTKIKFSDLW